MKIFGADVVVPDVVQTEKPVSCVRSGVSLHVMQYAYLSMLKRSMPDSSMFLMFDLSILVW